MIIDNTGAYTTPSPRFTTTKGSFLLTSTESAPDTDTSSTRNQPWSQRSLGNTLDTFRHKESGEYFTWTRKQIRKWEQEGSINEAV